MIETTTIVCRGLPALGMNDTTPTNPELSTSDNPMTNDPSAWTGPPTSPHAITELPVPLAEHMQKIYREAVAGGRAGEDFFSVVTPRR